MVVSDFINFWARIKLRLVRFRAEYDRKDWTVGNFFFFSGGSVIIHSSRQAVPVSSI